VGGDISGGSDAYNAAVTGPPLRALNFSNLVQSRDETHAELARTVDDLAAWLQVVEGGLAMLLAPADDDAIEEEDEESYES
jgi:protein-serine/threonine kinase